MREESPDVISIRLRQLIAAGVTDKPRTPLSHQLSIIPMQWPPTLSWSMQFICGNLLCPDAATNG